MNTLSHRTVVSASLMLLACSGTNADLPPEGVGSGSVSTGGGANAGTSGGAVGGVAVGGGGTVAGGGTGNVPTGNVGNVPTGGTGNVGTGGVYPGGAPTLPPFDAGSDPLRNQVPAGQVCDRLAVVQCAGEEHCCINPGRTRDQCIQAQASACKNEAFLDAISLNPVAGYSMAAAEAAFTEFENRASQCDAGIASWAISIGGLRGVTAGTIPPGGDCTPPLGATTADGAAFHASCTNPESTACLPSSLTGAIWSCDPRGGPDTHCLTDINCTDGNYCNNDLNSPSLTAGRCFARKANGSPCLLELECQSLTCVNGTCVAPTSQTAYCL